MHPFPFNDRRMIVGRDRECWLGNRRLGSSDVAKVLGIAPDSHGGQWRVLRRMLRAPSYDTWTAGKARGHRWERTALIAYGEQHDEIVEVRQPRQWATYVGPVEWSTSTPDAFACDVRDGWGLVEIKTARDTSTWGDPGPIERWTDEAAQLVPPHYALQVYHQLWTIDAPWCDLVMLSPYYDLRRYRIHRDRDVAKGITIGAKGKVTSTRSAGRKRLDKRRMLEDHPELKTLFDEYTTTGAPSVTIRVTGLDS
jgi:hypothetical protein